MTAPRETPWYPVRTERLLLRGFHFEDHDDIHAYATDLQTVRFMEWGPNTLEVTRDHLARRIEEQAQWPRPHVSLAVELVEQRRVIGGLHLGLDGQGGADFGYCFGSPWWGRGYGFEAARALVGTAFGTLLLHRVWATCDVRNAGSIAVLEKLGMRREGTLRKNLLVRDGWRDTHVYGLLAEEWSAQ